MKFNKINGVFYLFIFLFLGIFAIGCSSKFNKSLEGLDQKNNSIVLFNMKVKNDYAPQYYHRILSVKIQSSTGEKKKYTLSSGGGIHYIELDGEWDGEFYCHLFSLSLKPGRYKMLFARGLAGNFWVTGKFYIPVFKEFEVKPGKITYIGNIVATIRGMRIDDRVVAGPRFPLGAQAILGFPFSAVDVVISDDYEKDLQLYRDKYPMLEKYEIEKAILPAWTRPLPKDLPWSLRRKGTTESEDVSSVPAEAY